MLGNKDNRPTWLSHTVWFENAKGVGGVGGFGKFDVNNPRQSTNIDRNWQAGLRSSIHYAYKTYRKSSVTFLLTKLGSRAEKNYIASLTLLKIVIFTGNCWHQQKLRCRVYFPIFSYGSWGKLLLCKFRFRISYFRKSFGKT